MQLHIGEQVFPALVDGATSGNFIDAALARRLALSCLPLAKTTQLRAANGQLLDCSAYVSLPVSLSALKFRITLWVVESATPLILGDPFLRYFNPCIAWDSREFDHRHGLRI